MSVIVRIVKAGTPRTPPHQTGRADGHLVNVDLPTALNLLRGFINARNAWIREGSALELDSHETAENASNALFFYMQEVIVAYTRVLNNPTVPLSDVFDEFDPGATLESGYTYRKQQLIDNDMLRFLSDPAFKFNEIETLDDRSYAIIAGIIDFTITESGRSGGAPSAPSRINRGRPPYNE